MIQGEEDDDDPEASLEETLFPTFSISVRLTCWWNAGGVERPGEATTPYLDGSLRRGGHVGTDCAMFSRWMNLNTKFLKYKNWYHCDYWQLLH